jgi:hypothetical protein
MSSAGLVRLLEDVVARSSGLQGISEADLCTLADGLRLLSNLLMRSEDEEAALVRRSML